MSDQQATFAAGANENLMFIAIGEIVASSMDRVGQSELRVWAGLRPSAPDISRLDPCT